MGTLGRSGCRGSEVVTLPAPQLTPRAGRFVLQVLGKNETVPREAPLSQEAYMLVEAWLARRPVEISSNRPSRGPGVRKPLRLYRNPS